MAETKTNGSGNMHVAVARMRNLPISTKHSIEISRHLRFKQTDKAKAFLEDVIAKAKPVPFKRFVRDMGHKSGMASGRFPVKAAKEFLRLVKSAEKNAEDLGLNTESLKIVHLLANKASIPMTGGRMRGATKRTHIEIKVAEGATKKKEVKAKKSAAKKEAKVPVAEKKPAAKKEEIKTQDTTKGESQ